MSSFLVSRMVLVVSVVLVLFCTFSCSVSGLPFEKKAYLNETSGLLYVEGMGYEIPETHIFNGSSISNRHSEESLALPSCGSDQYVDSFCTTPRGGNARCRRNPAWPIYSKAFTCSSSEHCATFRSLNNQRRDQCVSRNYYIIQLALAWANDRGSNGRTDSKKRKINDDNTGVSSFMASSDFQYYVSPNYQNLQVFSGNNVREAFFNHESPQAINIGAGANRAVQMQWGIKAGQVVNAYMAVYKAS